MESLTEERIPAGLLVLPSRLEGGGAPSMPGSGDLQAGPALPGRSLANAPPAGAAEAALGVPGLLPAAGAVVPLPSLSAVLRAWPSSTCAAREAKFREDSVSLADCASGDRLHTSSTFEVPDSASWSTCGGWGGGYWMSGVRAWCGLLLLLGIWWSAGLYCSQQILLQVK